MFCCWGKALFHRFEKLLFSNRFGDFIEERTQKAVEDVVYSEPFKTYLLDVIKASQSSPFKEIAEQYLGERVEVVTTGGGIQGIVKEVGDDYLVLEESSTSVLIVPFTSVLTIQEANE
ncbi:DUF2642 domain-containing protein [Priestia koreensis]|uniref:DUF2642 domain-containing protein n=1 Tax=Priestia koreensis TaxID=284581 RepID=UPI001F5615C5|nr:DUF2642 domain-containing protein [Priestia koreensis]MCM3005260.1 YuzF family protein [Priestia koreensis]UNL86477.1 DUF2642 domain-containing protein [Priestia koreensis]